MHGFWWSSGVSGRYKTVPMRKRAHGRAPPLHFLILVQLEGSRIDAVAFLGGGWPVVKDMPKVGITAIA